MTKYITLDRSFVKKFWAILGRMGRVTCERYGSKCEKEIFVQRTLNKWFNKKSIAYITKDATGFFKHKEGFMGKEITIPTKNYGTIWYISYVLGYGEEIAVNIYNPVKLASAVSRGYEKMTEGEMLGFEFCEVPNEKLQEISKLFEDDRPVKKFLFSTWNMKPYVRKNKREGTVVLEGKDWEEARDTFEQVEQIYLNNMIKIIEYES